MDIFTVLFYQPLFNILVVFYRFFGGDLGLAIIFIALLSRLVTLPITLRQMKMMEVSKDLNAKMKAVKEKHKNDKELQNKELMKLQSEYLPAQLSGCLPLIIQFILLINIYHVISDLIIKGVVSFNAVAYSFVPQFDPNFSLNFSFLKIINLNVKANEFQFSNPSIIPYVVLIILVGISQYYSMKISMNQTAARNAVPEKQEKEKKKKDSKEKPAEDFSEIMVQTNKQMMLLFPFMTMLIGFSFPAGLSLYWIVQSGFVIIQQFFVTKLKLRGQKTQIK